MRSNVYLFSNHKSLVVEVAIHQWLVVALLQPRIIPKVCWAVKNICRNVRLNTNIILRATVR